MSASCAALASLVTIGASTRAPAQGVPRAARTLPSAFVENVGQAARTSRFIAREGALVGHFEPHAIVLQRLEPASRSAWKAEVVRLEFENARAQSRLTGEDLGPTKLNFMLGKELETARTFAKLRYSQVWNGIDIQVRNNGKTLEYDVILAPGARVEDVVFRCDGVLDIREQPGGRLALSTSGGELVQSPPVAWTEDVDGTRRRVGCEFRRIDARRFGFTAAERGDGHRLVIDPGVEWSTFVGGSNYDYFWKLAKDSSGDCVLAGYTASANFPTKAGSYDATYNGSVDGVVAKLSRDGSTLLWATFLGGSSEDFLYGVDVAANGEVFVIGFTKSNNYPVTAGAFQQSNQGGSGECCVSKLSADGSKLLYSTYLGGKGWDWPAGIAVDKAGAAVVIGVTKSTDFPVTSGAFDTSHNGGGDGFVAKLSPDGQRLDFCTFLGSSGWDPLNDLVLDDNGNVFITGDIFGVNNSSNFPVTKGAYDTSYNDTSDRSDTIVVKLSADGSKLLWSTWLGGDSWDPGFAIVLDPAGNPTVCGESWSTNFPVSTNAVQKVHNGGGDAYVARLSADGSKLLFATYLGGKTGEDQAMAVGIDPFGAIVIGGWTKSSDFPTTAGAIHRTLNGAPDTFVARLSPDVSKLWYSTLFNGSAGDRCYALSIDARGSAQITGDTFGADFVTTAGAFDTSYNRAGDAYVASLDLLPAGVSRFGTWKVACSPSLPIGITTRPSSTTKDFALLCAGAPAVTGGVLLIGAGRLPVPVTILGAGLLIDPTMPMAIVPVVSDASGSTTIPLPLTSPLKGARLFNQFLWFNTASCGGVGTLSSSNAIDFTVQE